VEITKCSYHDIALSLFDSSKDVEERFLFSGTIDDQITSLILQLSESEMENKKEELKVKKRVFYVLVESLQNITRHKEEGVPEIDSKSIMVVQKYKGTYQVVTGNLVKKVVVDWLRDKLESINSLGADDLKAIYYELLNNGSISSKGGAGLGLIEMARKTKNPIGFEFTPVNDDFSYFYMQMTLGDCAGIGEDQKFVFENISNFHQLMTNNGVDIVFQNRYNQQSVLNLLKLTKGGIKSDVDKGKRKKLNSVMVEMLQNVTKHGGDENEDGNMGFFSIGSIDGKTVLSCSNPVDSGDMEKLEKQLDEINKLDADQLEEMYNDVLVNHETTSLSTGLGLIDIRIKTQEKLNYYLKRLDSGKLFFTLEARI